MKKDKRTKAQLLEEINNLKEEIATFYHPGNFCRRRTPIEIESDKKMHELFDDKNVFKDSLKFILRNVKQ